MKVHCPEQGFTLIEVLIAITLLAIGVLAAAGMQISAIGGNHLAIRVTEASTLAGSTAEDLSGLGFDDPLLAPTVDPATVDPSDPATLAAALADLDTATQPAIQPDGFEVFWNVADDQPLADYKTVRVMARRLDRGNAERIVAVDFIIVRQ